jgi:hypothetical protein
MRERAENQENALDNEYKSNDFDINEDISSLTLLKLFIRAIKTFEIFAQVIKRNWGAYDGDQKAIYVNETFNLSMRLLSVYLHHIKSNSKDIIDYVYYVADKREIENKSDIEKLARQLIFNLSYMTSFGLIKRISNSISHIQLKDTFTDVISANPTNANKLIGLSISMDHFGALPINEIKELFTKDKNFNKYYLTKMLLRNFVYQYLHMWEVPWEERSLICGIVGISIENQRQIQGSSKEKK